MLILGQSGTVKTFFGKKNPGKFTWKSSPNSYNWHCSLKRRRNNTSQLERYSGRTVFARETLLKKNLLNDESYYEKRQAIFTTDVLIVDEISMLSMKIFDTLEYVCRKLRNNNTNFGSLQVMAIGDFFSNCHQCLIH